MRVWSFLPLCIGSCCGRRRRRWSGSGWLSPPAGWPSSPPPTRSGRHGASECAVS